MDEFGREPFQHPVLTDVDKLSYRQPGQIVQIEKLARLGLDVGLGEVMRWKPRMVSILADLSGNRASTDRPSLAGKPRRIWY